jgi:hypothetical protein
VPVRALPAPPNILALKFGSCSSGCASAVGPWCLRLLAQGSNPAASCTTLFPGFTSLLALCGPESRTPAPAPAPAFHGPAHTRPRPVLALPACPRQLVPAITAAACVRRICYDLRPATCNLEGPCALSHTSTKLRASVAHASSPPPPPHPATAPGLGHRNRPSTGLAAADAALGLTASPPSVVCRAQPAASLLARCGRMLDRHGSPFVITTVSAFLVPRQGRCEPRKTRHSSHLACEQPLHLPSGTGSPAVWLLLPPA